MPTPTSPTASAGLLSNYLVGRPVARAHGIARCNDLTFLLAKAGGQVVHDAEMRSPANVSSPVEVPVQYCRTPGARVVLVEVWLFGTTTAARGTVSVAVSAGSLSWINQGGLDGSTVLYAPNVDAPTSADGPIRALLDVTAVTVGTIVDLTFTVTNTAAMPGMRHLTLTEIPLPAVDPVGSPSTEVGFDGTWPGPRNRIVDGTASTSRGIARLAAEMLRARRIRRQVIQITTHDDIQALWNTNSGSLVNVHGTDITFRVRAQRYYATSSPEPCTFRGIYRTTDGTTTGELRITDGTNTTTLTLPASTSRTAVSDAFSLRTDGTLQEADLTVTHRVTPGSTGQLYTIGWALFGNRT